MTADHERDLAEAFDGQAAAFERAPVQSDPLMLQRLVAFAALPAGSRVLDAGCGPGLVSEAFLTAGHSVLGVDLSSEMVRRARARGAPFGARARFEQGSVFDRTLATVDGAGFDAAVSRYVIHHVVDPLAFTRQQAGLLRPGGVLVACDHTTDPDPARARAHQDIERARDRTHTANLTPGALVDLFAAAGLADVGFAEESFALDFDEWFDRGTPAVPKDTARAWTAACIARGFAGVPRPGGALEIACWRGFVRGVKR